jgi:LmbE family N-acetylglucosaminyl deacetylase
MISNPEKTLLVGAHPDDIEVMIGALAMDDAIEAYALVASLGRQGEHRGGEQCRRLCRRR